MSLDRDTATAERLILAVGGGQAGLDRALRDLDPPEVAALLVSEIAFRSDPALNPHEMHVLLDLTHGAHRETHTFTVAAGQPVRAVPRALETACVRLEFELAELARLLYGPQAGRATGTHRTELLLERPAVRERYASSLREVWPSIGQAVDTVLRPCRGRAPDLGELAVRYGSDKWGLLHWFTPHYERFLGPLRDQPVRVLEIGIGGYKDPSAGGESLLMWKRYFPRGLVFGLDVFDKHGLDQPRITTLTGDQNDPGYLAGVAERYGPFDVVIDDGSHINEHILTSFQALLPHVRAGGVYVIEDLWTSYCPGFGGETGSAAGPSTSLGLLKSLVDAVHHEEWSADVGPAGQASALVTGVHIHHNIAFVEKGTNAEGGIPPWIPHSFDELVAEPVTASAS
ncbi:MAG TPA: hypothetical protein VGS19_33040 [Streptosporangiaceae bacterium]|nr:hypothetical protein [Streptosporangiaceae bacterium]